MEVICFLIGWRLEHGRKDTGLSLAEDLLGSHWLMTKLSHLGLDSQVFGQGEKIFSHWEELEGLMLEYLNLETNL